MIRRFENDTALLVIDPQVGVNDIAHWGGPGGARNNPGCEANIARLLAAFRGRDLPVIYTQHCSRQKVSPLKLGTPGGEFLPGLGPEAGELVIRKDVNSGFEGTSLELELRRRQIYRLVVVGYFTNFCVETTVRAAGNMGYDVYLGHDACATSNRRSVDGTMISADEMHAAAVASMNAEFCTALATQDVLALVAGDCGYLQRVQGNEFASPLPSTLAGEPVSGALHFV